MIWQRCDFAASNVHSKETFLCTVKQGTYNFVDFFSNMFLVSRDHYYEVHNSVEGKHFKIYRFTVDAQANIYKDLFIIRTNFRPFILSFNCYSLHYSKPYYYRNNSVENYQPWSD